MLQAFAILETLAQFFSLFGKFPGGQTRRPGLFFIDRMQYRKQSFKVPLVLGAKQGLNKFF